MFSRAWERGQPVSQETKVSVITGMLEGVWGKLISVFNEKAGACFDHQLHSVGFEASLCLSFPSLCLLR